MTREILHADLLGRNSFGVAATADRIVEFSDAASLRDYLAAHEDIRQGKLGVLGGGNNILFTEDFTERCCTPQAKVSRSRAPRATASRYGQKRDSTGRSSWNGASASVCGGRKT